MPIILAMFHGGGPPLIDTQVRIVPSNQTFISFIPRFGKITLLPTLISTPGFYDVTITLVNTQSGMSASYSMDVEVLPMNKSNSNSS